MSSYEEAIDPIDPSRSDVESLDRLLVTLFPFCFAMAGMIYMEKDQAGY